MSGPLAIQNGEAAEPGLGVLGELLRGFGLGATEAATLEGLIVFLGTLVALYLVGRVLVVPLVERALDRRGLDDHAQTPLLLITRFLVVFVAIAIAFGAADYGNFLVSMAGIAAAGALAIGFAMQNVIANFVAGVFIYADEPFRIGDWIEWDGHSGVVEDISLRVTRVRTFDNELLTVPNSQLTSGVVKNPVEGEKLRVKFVFGIGYDDDIDEATDIIVEEAKKHEAILDEPAPSVRLIELGDSDVGLQSRWWIEDPDRGDFVKIRSEYVQSVKEAFDAAGIDIPYVHRELTGSIETIEAIADDE